MRFTRFTLLAAALVMVLPVSAQANVIYTFNDVGNPGFPSMSFTLDVPTFITTDTTFTNPAAGFACTATGVFFITGHTQSCRAAQFTPNPITDNLLVIFTDDVTGTVGYGSFFDFIKGAFTTPGTYTAPLPPNTSSNSLTVALVATPVPEPLTLSIFGAGIAGVLAARRRRKAARRFWFECKHGALGAVT